MAIFLFLSVMMVALFSFLGVASFADARRREREAYYKGETLRKVAEAQGPAAVSALEMLREEDRIAERRRLEGLRLGGLITAAVGVSLGVFLRGVAQDPEPVWLVGAIPFAIGLAILVYVYGLAPKEDRKP